VKKIFFEGKVTLISFQISIRL